MEYFKPNNFGKGGKNKPKCNKIKLLLSHDEDYKCIFDSSERNGCAIFEMI